MRPEPLVTIGIPTYNRARSFLREALESALAQTYPNIEIVVSDNGSTDGTETVVREYNDPRIRYFRQQPSLIPNDNFNFCLKQARGVYFLLLHDDDKVDADFIQACMQAADYRTDVGVIHAAIRIMDSKGTVRSVSDNDVEGLGTGELFLAWFAGKTSFYLCGTLYHTAGLKKTGGFHSRHNLFQDVMATARLVATMGRISIGVAKASAREHGAKWTHVARVKEWSEDSLDLLRLLCELAPEHAAELQEKGRHFFANVNYGRASDIRSASKRLVGYRVVYQLFGRSHFPPPRMVFQSTWLYRRLRHMKRRLLGLPAWVD